VSRPHLLYIAFFFPPSRASGVYRALATVRAFTDAGWDVTVITTEERFFEDEIGSIDRSLLDFVPDGVRVERVQFSFRGEIPVTDLKDLGWFRGNFPVLWAGMRQRLHSALVASDVLRGRSPLSFPMDDRYVAWIDPVVAHARKLHSRSPFDHVLATGNPYSAFEAARVISAIHDLPFTIDYRDPWAFDMRTTSLAKLSAPTFAAEERIVAQAHACVQVNEAIAEAYADLYPEHADKQHVVINGYDAESIPNEVRVPNRGPLKYGMLGTVTDLWPLGPLFEAWHQARDRLPRGSVLRLGGHLGYFPWSAEPLEATFPDTASGFEYVGAVPKERVSEFYGDLDVVIVALFGGPMLTAGKVIEVAALGVPILCIQAKDGGGRRFYESLPHPLAIGVDPDPDAISDALLRVSDLAAETDVQQRVNVRRMMEPYERLAAMRGLVDTVARAQREILS
jgi:glycosyltransferase involved in cell wall biosynthesis